MSRQLYLGAATIGIVTALPKERAAARMAFSPNVKAYGKSGNLYYLSSVPCCGGELVVAITTLSMMGNNAAAVQVTNLIHDCENVSDVIMVGIAGAIPCPNDAARHVRLGDIVVSGQPGVLQFDLGKKEAGDNFQCRSIPTRPSPLLSAALTDILSNELLGERAWEGHIERVVALYPNWRRPDESTDVLDDGNGPLLHPSDPKRRKDFPRLFIGAIGSSNTLLKDAAKRDQLPGLMPDDRGVLYCVEMEGSGVQDASWFGRAGWLIVRGTCDYCNATKNDIWQEYAALIAAAFTRTLVEELPAPDSSSQLPPVQPSRNTEVTQQFGNLSNCNHVAAVAINAQEVHLHFHIQSGVPTTGMLPHQSLSGLDIVAGTRVDPSTLDAEERETQAKLAAVRAALIVWDYARSLELTDKIEGKLLNNVTPISAATRIEALILATRVHMNVAEASGKNIPADIARAKLLLDAATTNTRSATTEQIAEIEALRASLVSVQLGPDAALRQIADRIDPYAVRVRAALLLKSNRVAEAAGVIENLEPHERWCDVAVTIFALNGNAEKARQLVRWAEINTGRNEYTQCVIRLAEGLMGHALAKRETGKYVRPDDVTADERTGLEATAEVLAETIKAIRDAGRPTNQLEMAAVNLSWTANYLLRDKLRATEALELMNHWTPIPLDLAKGVLNGYIAPPADLPERLLQDYPNDFDAGLLAGLLETVALGRHPECFRTAKTLVPLAENEEKKQELAKLLQQVWPQLQEPEVAECEDLIGLLNAQEPAKSRIHEAARFLRKGNADACLETLTAQEAPNDIFWLQLHAHALMKKGKTSEAVDSFLAASKQTLAPGLLRITADLAYQAKRPQDAAWCYERIIERIPKDVQVRSNLAHLYAFVLNDTEKAAAEFRALHELEPERPVHLFNLAVSLTQLYRPDESLACYEELCKGPDPSLLAILGRAQLLHSLNRPGDALASLQPLRATSWNDKSFLLAYTTVARAAGDDHEADEAFKVMIEMQQKGTLPPGMLHPVAEPDAVQMFVQLRKQELERTTNVHDQMLVGRMPWVWAEQGENNPIYQGWRTRTQEIKWLGDDARNRARFCIYATNGFHARTEGGRCTHLQTLVCPPQDTRIVADISALITLHRLGLLDAASEYFGEILVPAGYLTTVLDDSRQMVLHQRSQQQGPEEIERKVATGAITVVAEGADPGLPVVDEFSEATDHRFHLVDIVTPLQEAGLITAERFAEISRLYAKQSAVDAAHPIPSQTEALLIDVPTLEALANYGILDAITTFYRIHIRADAKRDLTQKLAAFKWREESRMWHMDLWDTLRRNPKIHFVPHRLPATISGEARKPKDFLPFMACFVANDNRLPLLADDRVCQAFVLNEQKSASPTAFGTDVLALALLDAERLDPTQTANIIRQLITWRYRFIVPPATVLKTLSDQYRGAIPGQALQEMAEYIQACMRDPGLFAGPEKTECGDSMAMRSFITWISAIAEFLVLVWADETFSEDAATRLTTWVARELLPSIPTGVRGSSKYKASIHTANLFVGHALIKAGMQAGEPRLAEAMKAIRIALRLDTDEYCKIVTETLDAATRANT